MKAPMKVFELIDLLTNPKWWPDGKPGMNAEIAVRRPCVGDDENDMNGVASPCRVVHLNPVFENETREFVGDDGDVLRAPFINDEDDDRPNAKWVVVVHCD